MKRTPSDERTTKSAVDELKSGWKGFSAVVEPAAEEDAMTEEEVLVERTRASCLHTTISVGSTQRSIHTQTDVTDLLIIRLDKISFIDFFI